MGLDKSEHARLLVDWQASSVYREHKQRPLSSSGRYTDGMVALMLRNGDTFPSQQGF